MALRHLPPGRSERPQFDRYRKRVDSGFPNTLVVACPVVRLDLSAGEVFCGRYTASDNVLCVVSLESYTESEASEWARILRLALC